MVRGQHLRVAAIQEFDDITVVASGQDPVSIAMNEIEEGTLSFVRDAFDDEIRGSNAEVLKNL